MKIFLVAFIVVVCFEGLESAKTAVLNRRKRQEDIYDYVTVKEGDVKTYVARCKYGDNLIVGKYILEWNTIYIPYHGKELAFQEVIDVPVIELLVLNKYNWIPYPGFVPANAIEFGYEGAVKLFIGRRQHDGKTLIGKIVQGYNSIFCPYFRREIRFDDDFDILTF